MKLQRLLLAACLLCLFGQSRCASLSGLMQKRQTSSDEPHASPGQPKNSLEPVPPSPHLSLDPDMGEGNSLQPKHEKPKGKDPQDATHMDESPSADKEEPPETVDAGEVQEHSDSPNRPNEPIPPSPQTPLDPGIGKWKGKDPLDVTAMGKSPSLDLGEPLETKDAGGDRKNSETLTEEKDLNPDEEKQTGSEEKADDGNDDVPDIRTDDKNIPSNTDDTQSENGDTNAKVGITDTPSDSGIDSNPSSNPPEEQDEDEDIISESENPDSEMEDKNSEDESHPVDLKEHKTEKSPDLVVPTEGNTEGEFVEDTENKPKTITILPRTSPGTEKLPKELTEKVIVTTRSVPETLGSTPPRKAYIPQFPPSQGPDLTKQSPFSYGSQFSPASAFPYGRPTYPYPMSFPANVYPTFYNPDIRFPTNRPQSQQTNALPELNEASPTAENVASNLETTIETDVSTNLQTTISLTTQETTSKAPTTTNSTTTTTTQTTTTTTQTTTATSPTTAAASPTTTTTSPTTTTQLEVTTRPEEPSTKSPLVVGPDDTKTEALILKETTTSAKETTKLTETEVDTGGDDDDDSRNRKRPPVVGTDGQGGREGGERVPSEEETVSTTSTKSESATAITEENAGVLKKVEKAVHDVVQQVGAFKVSLILLAIIALSFLSIFCCCRICKRKGYRMRQRRLKEFGQEKEFLLRDRKKGNKYHNDTVTLLEGSSEDEF